jgi:hypothetical protein
MAKPVTNIELPPLCIKVLFPDALRGGPKLETVSAIVASVAQRLIAPDSGLVFAPRLNIFEAQSALCQFLEFSPDLHINGLITATKPHSNAAGMEVGLTNGIPLGPQDVQCFRVVHHWLLLPELCTFSRSCVPPDFSTLIRPDIRSSGSFSSAHVPSWGVF